MVNADFTVKIGGEFLVIQSFESLSCVQVGSSCLWCVCVSFAIVVVYIF